MMSVKGANFVYFETVYDMTYRIECVLRCRPSERDESVWCLGSSKLDVRLCCVLFFYFCDRAMRESD